MNPPQMEREVKITLNKVEDLQRITEQLGKAEIKNQVNTYYTTAKAQSNKTAIRIRTTQDGKSILTVKSKAQIQNGYFQCEEHEYEGIDEQTLFKNFQKYLPGETECPHKYTSFSTTRHVIYYDQYKIELDLVKCEKETFAEIECETEEPEKYKDFIIALLEQLKIDWSYSKSSKLQRVLSK